MKPKLTLFIFLISIPFSYSQKKDFKAELDAFFIQVIQTYKDNDYESYKNLYMTLDESIELFAYYGYPKEYAISEHYENVKIKSEEEFGYKMQMQKYQCDRLEGGEPYVRNGPGPFSEIFHKKLSKKDAKNEYYIFEGPHNLKCYKKDSWGDEYLKLNKPMEYRLGELIRLPNGQWRMTQGY